MMNPDQLYQFVLFVLVTISLILGFLSYLNSYDALLPVKLVIYLLLILSILLFIAFYYAPVEIRPLLYTGFGFPNFLIALNKLFVIIIAPENLFFIKVYSLFGLLMGIFPLKRIAKKLREERMKKFY